MIIDKNKICILYSELFFACFEMVGTGENIYSIVPVIISASQSS